MEGKLSILFLADGRSPIASGWIRYFIERGHEVHLASTYPFRPDPRLSSSSVIPVAFSDVALGGEKVDNKVSLASLARRYTSPKMRTTVRQLFGSLTIPLAARRLRKYVDTVMPDLVHAMRIPYEGMMATFADPPMPLIVSVWGNDFTLHATSNAWMAAMTRKTMERADALHTDCHRDLRLAQSWGFAQGRPVVVLPSGGGVDLEVFYIREESPLTSLAKGESPLTPLAKGESPLAPLAKGGIGPGVPTSRTGETMQDLDEGNKITVINPRGLRAYVRNDTFFKSVPIVLSRGINARFLCLAMAGEPQAERWLRELGIGGAVELLPRQSLLTLADLYRQAHISLSITDHDGTPNTLLESMACGCFPIASDLESIREWITHLENGLLIDPGDPHALAEAILFAIRHPELRARAQVYNTRLISERADYKRVMVQAEQFYLDCVIRKRGTAVEYSNCEDDGGLESRSGGRAHE